MKKCECGCVRKGKEMFCILCFHNFDSKESYHEFDKIHLCPKCHPKDNLFKQDAMENNSFILKCHGCWKEIPENESYFSGYMCPPRLSGKFGCAPHVYYCENCTEKLPCYFKPSFT
jgi:hypothetical protein